MLLLYCFRVQRYEIIMNSELRMTNDDFFPKNLRNSKEMSTFAPQIVEKVTNK